MTLLTSRHRGHLAPPCPFTLPVRPARSPCLPTFPRFRAETSNRDGARRKRKIQRTLEQRWRGSHPALYLAPHRARKVHRCPSLSLVVSPCLALSSPRSSGEAGASRRRVEGLPSRGAGPASRARWRRPLADRAAKLRRQASPSPDPQQVHLHPGQELAARRVVALAREPVAPPRCSRHAAPLPAPRGRRASTP